MDYTLFGKGHLILLLLSTIFIVISTLLLNKLTHKNSKKIKISFIIIYILVVLSELAKQIHGLYEFGEINASYYPFHICSYALYFFPLVALTKKYPKNFSLTVAILGIIPGLVTIIYPANVLQGGFVTINSFFYHSLMIIFGIQILKSGVYTYKPKDFVYALLGIAIIFAVALTANSLVPNSDYAFLGNGESAPFGAWFIGRFGKLLYVITVFSLFSFVVFLFQLPLLVSYLVKHRTLRTIQQKNSSF